MDWSTINNIPQKVIEIGLIEKSKSSPLVTNCRLFPLLIFLDIRKLGYNPYVGSASHKIRQRGAGRRLKTIIGLDVMELAVKTDIFRTVFGYGIRNVLDYLDIGPEEFLELARQS